MLDRSRPRRSPARYLAPIVLVAVAVAIYLVVHHATAPARPAHQSSQAQQRTRSAARSAAQKHAKQQPRYYTVRSGDSLSVISARTGVPLPTLQSLNPKAASGALQIGQRLRLR